MLPKIKSVPLISRSDKAYLSYCKDMRYQKNINRGETTPDTTLEISKWIEKIINKLISQKYKKIEADIITWQELTSYGTYIKRYKEMDGLFEFENGYAILEVKASVSKSSFKRGISQIKSNVDLVSVLCPNLASILVLADCRRFDKNFGYAIDKVMMLIQNEMNFSLITGLDPPVMESESKNIFWIISDGDIEKIAQIYGSPQDED